MPYQPSGSNGYTLHYPFGRDLGSVMFIVIGSIFVVTGFLIPDIIFNIAFPLLGGLCALAGVYAFANALTVKISPEFIETTRFLFGIVIKKRTLPSYAFKEFKAVKASGSQNNSQNNGAKKQYYDIQARGKDGQKLIVAEKIDGEGQAKAAIERLLGFL